MQVTLDNRNCDLCRYSEMLKMSLNQEERPMVEASNSERAGQGDNADLQQQGPPDADVCGCGAVGGRSWKTVIFLAVIVLAGGVAAHSLLRDGNPTTPAGSALMPCGTSACDRAASCDKAKACESAGACGGAKLCPKAACAEKKSVRPCGVVCGVKVDSFKSLKEVAKQNNASVVFIFLAGENEETTRAASSEVEMAIAKLSAQDKQVAAVTLEAGTEEYNSLVRDVSMASLPSVIVIAKGHGRAVVSGEINEASLLAAFVKATSASCGFPGSAGCSPR